ncbi:MAG: hypothetical protein QOI25_809 [Mycobacterium sp.]|nr:hypothetical protein [Mycobacterium sp.]
MDEAVADPAVVRENQLDLASDVFSTGRVQRACFDEVVAKSGIPEAAFGVGDGDGDGDDLIRAYLQSRFASIQDRMLRELSGFPCARQRIIGVFEILGLSFAEPAFERDVGELTLSTEASLPETLVEGVSTKYHDWIHSLFCDLAHAAQFTHPEELAEQLVMIYRGTCMTAWMDGRPDIAATASSLARTVVATATDPSANWNSKAS